MYRLLILILILLAAAPCRAAVADLGWLAGCWERSDADPGSVEHWTAPAGGVMLGMSRTMRDGVAVFWEFLVLRDGEDGGVELTAHPSGQEGGTFLLVESGPDSVVFGNDAHDFPQRILYRRDGDALHGRIEGRIDGEFQAVDFPLHRVDCD